MKKIAQITDLHVDDYLAKKYKIDARKNFENALKLSQSRGVSDVILTGDLGASEANEWVFETIRSHGFDFHVVLGNHDNLVNFHKFDFLKTLIKDDGLYFSKTIYGIESECIFLDSSAGEVGETQLEWLRRQISGSSEPFLIFIHHPILACGDPIIDRLFSLKNRDTLRQILIEAEREIAIFCGHYHSHHSEEKREGKLRQFLTPATFGQIKQYDEEIRPDDSGYIAYREIYIKDEKLQTEIIEI